MCGIAGVVNWGDSETLARMTHIQTHRGPDDAGLWEQRFPDGTWIGLGNRRLAIIDLSPAGHMPMSNENGTIWITYNGEVYNFPELRQELLAKGRTFRSNTDTEVILHLYEQEGPECVKRLNGMFAFAICDLRSSTPLLFLARDHFGIKPLYYIHQGHRFAFASEVKALLQLPDVQAEVDLEALHQYLTFLWVPDPKTMFKGIYKLPAGHYALFKDGHLDIVQYWDLTFPPAEADYAYTEAELVEAIRERFRRSVQAQMISDVPIGAFLSAGMDSSSIVAMMSQATNEPVRTYTITFPPKYRVGETTLDNPSIASQVARHFGCDHHEIVVEPRVAELLPKLIWHMDEPVADPAIITAYLVCREARRTVTVLLSGIGGDELFAGYRKHYAHYWAQAYRRLPAFLRQHVIEPAILGLPSFRGTPIKGLVRLAKKMVRSSSLTPEDSFLMNCTYLDETQKAELYSPVLRTQLVGMDPWRQHRLYFDRVAHADFLNQMLYLDIKTFMVSLNLTYNDKMSMASSVEVRVPFLDRELAEFVAWHVPPYLKLNGFLRPHTKYIFRKAMQGILPEEVLRQPKAGFGAPVDYWLAHDLREMVDDLLSEERVKRRGFFEPRAVQRLVEEHRSGRQDWSMQIWQLLTLELWLQTFVDHP
jgi:asparagine synthase (glutamine-hydrolysing)